MVELCYEGQARLRDGSLDLNSLPGEIITFPSQEGVLCGGFHSGISFYLDQSTLQRTIHSVLGGRLQTGMDRPMLINGKGSRSRLLFSLFQHIDRVLSEDRYLSNALVLDDQIYRTLVMDWARQYHGELLTSRWREKHQWNPSLDSLVDYIRLHSAQRLTMTDLEEHSHYSSRQLQYLFRDRFDCTPMQFIRRQRMTAAMERLQSPKRDDSVTRIARDYGYCFTSNFSADFRREFGIKPSAVLRAGGGDAGLIWAKKPDSAAPGPTAALQNFID